MANWDHVDQGRGEKQKDYFIQNCVSKTKQQKKSKFTSKYTIKEMQNIKGKKVYK